MMDNVYTIVSNVWAAGAKSPEDAIELQRKCQDKIEQIAIDNPDLSDGFISEALLAKAEVDLGAVTPYKRRTKRDER